MWNVSREYEAFKETSTQKKRKNKDQYCYKCSNGRDINNHAEVIDILKEIVHSGASSSNSISDLIVPESVSPLFVLTKEPCSSMPDSSPDNVEDLSTLSKDQLHKIEDSKSEYIPTFSVPDYSDSFGKTIDKFRATRPALEDYAIWASVIESWFSLPDIFPWFFQC